MIRFKSICLKKQKKCVRVLNFSTTEYFASWASQWLRRSAVALFWRTSDIFEDNCPETRLKMVLNQLWTTGGGHPAFWKKVGRDKCLRFVFGSSQSV